MRQDHERVDRFVDPTRSGAYRASVGLPGNGAHGGEREIAALLIDGLTSKLIGKRLAISPRTVDVYRARLMRKVGAVTTPELVNKLLAG